MSLDPDLDQSFAPSPGVWPLSRILTLMVGLPFDGTSYEEMATLSATVLDRPVSLSEFFYRPEVLEAVHAVLRKRLPVLDQYPFPSGLMLQIPAVDDQREFRSAFCAMVAAETGLGAVAVF